MRKIATLVTIAGIMVTQMFSAVPAMADTNQNYADAFQKSILFYEAQWCGPDAGDNRLPWRSACHTEDGKDVGLDLTGGFHDCGDHVKFQITNQYAAATLGWDYYEFKDTFKAKGQDQYMLHILKHFTDYFLKLHTDRNTLYYDVGNGDIDHSYWGPPELQDTIQPNSRPTMGKITPNNPGSDICGGTAAALAIMYLNYKDIDSTYANKCLTAAKEIYDLGNNYRGLSKQFGGYYTSSNYWDDLAWGGVWLYQATNDKTYLTNAETILQQNNVSQYYAFNWTHCWDNVLGGTLVELAKVTNDQTYKTVAEGGFRHWMNDVSKSSGGLCSFQTWGNLRYVTAECMTMLAYNKTFPNQSYVNFAKGQIDYILGNNPKGMSYEVGYGSNYPKFPHNRAASGRKEFAPYNESKKQPELNIIYGELVGGPSSSDSYNDDIEDYTYSEGGIDYNAGFVGALAGLTEVYGQSQTPSVIPGLQAAKWLKTTPTPTPTPSGLLGDLNKDGVVNNTDLALLRNYLLNHKGTIDKSIWDVNKDNKINVLDYLKLGKIIKS
ncbi:MAG: glycoside hydrolase family 9 protein [Bacillota bacterium]|nr:glycoside hydrolase family 9 protein [Bacillota bacterium]